MNLPYVPDNNDMNIVIWSLPVAQRTVAIFLSHEIAASLPAWQRLSWTPRAQRLAMALLPIFC